MEPQTQTSKQNDSAGNPDLAVKSATKLTPLDLNNIRLDVRHTILTPDYLEKLQDNITPVSPD